MFYADIILECLSTLKLVTFRNTSVFCEFPLHRFAILCLQLIEFVLFLFNGTLFACNQFSFSSIFVFISSCVLIMY